MRDVLIAQGDSQKGRQFRAVCLATIEADSLWDGGATAGDKIRPVWAAFAGSDGELRPFVANMRGGRRILFAENQRSYSRKRGEQMEFLRSAEYDLIWQRSAEGAIVTCFLRDLFRPDPGMVDPSGVRFVMLAQRAHLLAQELPDVSRAIEHARKFQEIELASEDDARALVASSMLFAAYVDRRTHYPLVADARFYLQFFYACLRDGFAGWSRETIYGEKPFGVAQFAFDVADADDLGLDRPVAFLASHDAVKELLAVEVDVYFSTVS